MLMIPSLCGFPVTVVVLLCLNPNPAISGVYAFSRILTENKKGENKTLHEEPQ